jgi:hypothetical protein
VNLAARVETYTKQVGASLLVSEHTVALLDDPGAYMLRAVDRVRFKGKSRPVLVYEVLDALPEAERGRKLATRQLLEEGRAAMLEGRLECAIERLQAALDIDPEDPVPVRCLERCRAFVRHGVPEGWDGVTNLEEK